MAAVSPVFYLIPGLGADARIFERLRLVGTVRVLNWLEPTDPHEPLAAYAARLAAPIAPAEICWVVGVSFGGVVALEIGCLRPNARVVLISSLSTPAERTGWLALGRRLHLDVWLPVGLLRRLPRAGEWFFGVSGRRGNQLFREILALLTPVYTRWALRSLFRWNGCTARAVAHIIGTRDRVFPLGYRSATHIIGRATHFLIVTHAGSVSRILNDLARSNAPAIPAPPA